jgi:hypothetical protein
LASHLLNRVPLEREPELLGSARLQRAGCGILPQRTFLATSWNSLRGNITKVRDSRMPSPARHTRALPRRRSRWGRNTINYLPICRKKLHCFSPVRARNAWGWDVISPNDILSQRICFVMPMKSSVETCATLPGTDR